MKMNGQLLLDFTFAIWNKIDIKHLTVDVYFRPVGLQKLKIIKFINLVS